jgi:hypothetical protein
LFYVIEAERLVVIALVHVRRDEPVWRARLA